MQQERRWPIATACAVAVALALYTGFRMPSSWAVTLQAVSITDGFHKRFLVGTLLRPVNLLTGFSYWGFVALSFAVLAAIVAILIRAAVRERSAVRRLAVVTWLLLPTGAFLFHEVGYLDQVVYLALFVAMGLVDRRRFVAATAVMACAPMVHELALLTVLPLFTVLLLAHLPLRRAALLAAVPIAIALLLLAVPAASSGTAASLGETLATAHLRYRADALLLFEQSYGATSGAYDVGEQLVRLVPAIVIVLVSCLGVMLSERAALRAPEASTAPRWLLAVALCGAVCAPGLLGLGGWDSNRWVFFLISNLFIAVWLIAGRLEQVRVRTIVVMVTALLVVDRIPIYYFDAKAPRQLGIPELVRFVQHPFVKPRD